MKMWVGYLRVTYSQILGQGYNCKHNIARNGSVKCHLRGVFEQNYKILQSIRLPMISTGAILMMVIKLKP